MANAAAPPSHIATVEIPTPVTSVAFSPGGLLAIGSEDGTARIYHLPDTKAQRAVMGLNDEISSIAFANFSSNSVACKGVWLAFGGRVAHFDTGGEILVMRLADATLTHTLLTGSDGSDVLNEIAVSSTHLGFTSDSGIVGVLDLRSGMKSEMRTRHSSIAGSISFIPDRPGELVSGGYDCHLLHFDFRQGVALSRFNFESSEAPDSGSNVSLSPPFVTSLVVSSTGIIAAGAADGQLWMGFGGEKSPTSNHAKKKRRYWEGLKEGNDSFRVSIAQGPIVGAGFLSADQIITCSLGGKLTSLLHAADHHHSRNVEQAWTYDIVRINKVNSMKVGLGTTNDGVWIGIGGIGANGEGCFQLLHSVVQDAAP